MIVRVERGHGSYTFFFGGFHMKMESLESKATLWKGRCNPGRRGLLGSSNVCHRLTKTIF